MKRLAPDSDKFKIFNMKVSPEWTRAIDDWRATQRPIMNRSEAIRVLVMKGLEAEEN